MFIGSSTTAARHYSPGGAGSWWFCAVNCSLFRNVVSAKEFRLGGETNGESTTIQNDWLTTVVWKLKKRSEEGMLANSISSHREEALATSRQVGRAMLFFSAFHYLLLPMLSSAIETQTTLNCVFHGRTESQSSSRHCLAIAVSRGQ